MYARALTSNPFWNVIELFRRYRRNFDDDARKWCRNDESNNNNADYESKTDDRCGDGDGDGDGGGAVDDGVGDGEDDIGSNEPMTLCA